MQSQQAPRNACSLPQLACQILTISSGKQPRGTVQALQLGALCM